MIQSIGSCSGAIVAGIMIYISLDELLPTAEKYGKHHIAIAGVISGDGHNGDQSSDTVVT